ncbi:glycosyltransferase family 2 protein [Winogradskyella sp. A3E31]|uniref:glycosyltransferase family 2 protein n=1 Tax=Winogradskyella sp. A3E31 TaxID=3349637 RepID=UPI00398B0E8D
MPRLKILNLDHTIQITNAIFVLMLSVLIPVYDCSIYSLVKELHQQLTESGIDFEILCFDDGSTSSSIIENNNKVNAFSHTTYALLDKNYGRSLIRNKLASKAKYEYLLFIDNDSLITNANYIKKYITVLQKGYHVVYGGRVHPKEVEPQQTLRWKYGVAREDLNAQKRQLKKFKCLLFNNTVIKNTVFSSVKFSSDINTYGHEDTLLAYQLSLSNVNVLHIDNEVVHNTIDTNIEFLNKTDLSLQNLKSLYYSKTIDYNFVRFLRIYKKIERLGVTFILKFMYSVLKKPFQAQLCSKTPSLFIYDLYRFGYFSSINHKR